jgi:ribosomal protein S18 acetylase RimI-like enzyme/DNA-binding MarR family transcriptional regulator
MATSSPPAFTTPAIEAGLVNNAVLPLREASRRLVREWGFLRSTLAPFPLSPAAVHCLIEIGDYGRRVFPDLCAELNVTPTQLSHILAELVSRGTVKRELHPSGQAEAYSLTDAGRQTLAEINAYAQDQVTKALAVAPPGAGANITAAFQAYAAALERSRPITPAITPAATPEPQAPPAVAILPGYRPCILARTLEMHLDYYHPRNGWGREFEAALSQGLGDLLERLDKPVNQAWSAALTTPARDRHAPAAERIVGVVYVDGECSGEEGVARLRAFIVDESARGLGVGRKLLGAAMEFVKETGFRECYLTTAPELTVARRMYENAGFKQVAEDWYEGYGNGFMQITYIWRRPDEAGQA